MIYRCSDFSAAHRSRKKNCSRKNVDSDEEIYWLRDFVVSFQFAIALAFVRGDRTHESRRCHCQVTVVQFILRDVDNLIWFSFIVSPLAVANWKSTSLVFFSDEIFSILTCLSDQFHHGPGGGRFMGRCWSWNSFCDHKVSCLAACGHREDFYSCGKKRRLWLCRNLL